MSKLLNKPLSELVQKISWTLDGINLQLLDNESIGIVGESGSGKSSLGAALMQSMRPPGKLVGGSMMVDNVNIGNMPESRFHREIRWKKIAMVFQGAMNVLDPVYTIESQIREILRGARL